jgi:hypothetical protein
VAEWVCVSTTVYQLKALALEKKHVIQGFNAAFGWKLWLFFSQWQDMRLQNAQKCSKINNVFKFQGIIHSETLFRHLWKTSANQAY